MRQKHIQYTCGALVMQSINFLNLFRLDEVQGTGKSIQELYKEYCD